MLVKGIINFPHIFTPHLPKGADRKRFDCGVLLPPGDPQIAAIQAHVNTEIMNAYPSGMPPGTHCCFQKYEAAIPPGKEYHDPRLVGYMLLSCTAKLDDRPPVVDANHVAIIDPSLIFAGCVAEVHLGITYYATGKGGIGGWLNGVKFSNEVGPLGRLDGRPTVDQMFANASGANTNVTATGPAAPVTRQMTPAATTTYEQYIAANWTDAQLIQAGFMLPPGGVPLSF